MQLNALLQRTASAFLLRVTAAAVGLAMNVAVTRTLDLRSAGAFFLALTLITIGATIGRLGLDNTLLRFASAYAAAQQWGSLFSIYKKTIAAALIGSLSLAIALALSAQFLGGVVFSGDVTKPLQILSLAIVPLAMVVLHSVALQSVKRTSQAILVLSIWIPVLFTAGIFLFGSGASVARISGIYSSAVILTMLIGVFQWMQYLQPNRRIEEELPRKLIWNSSSPLFWSTLLNLVITWAPTIALGIFWSTSEVATFTAANRTSLIVSLALASMNMVVAPQFSALYRNGQLEELRAVARQSATLMFMVSAPVVFVIVLFPGHVMRLFGAAYAQNGTILAILGLAQFLNAVTGPVTYLLMMSGHERVTRNISLTCAALSLALCWILIPRAGATGAAIASAIILAAQNLLALGLVWKKLGFVVAPSLPQATMFLRGLVLSAKPVGSDRN